MIRLHHFHPPEASLSSIIMRAIVLLCLLNAVFGYSWNGPSQTTQSPDPDPGRVCNAGKESCGCCVMQKHLNRMEQFFNMSTHALNRELMESKLALNNMRASRSAFSVALNNENSLTCVGPFRSDRLVLYKHVFMNLGNSYDAQTGVFTVPRSGVYSFAVTVYSLAPQAQAACANLQINGKAAAELTENSGKDSEDSSTAVAAVQLEAGDQVAVSLPPGCDICDNFNHFNTFTGFLLYATEKVKA